MFVSEEYTQTAVAIALVGDRGRAGASLHGTFVGTAVHADDVRTIAPSIQSVISQFSEILSFTADVGLNLNVSKLENLSNFPNLHLHQLRSLWTIIL